VYQNDIFYRRADGNAPITCWIPYWGTIGAIIYNIYAISNRLIAKLNLKNIYDRKIKRCLF